MSSRAASTEAIAVRISDAGRGVMSFLGISGIGE
jgi:hypothetical protein